MDEIIQLHEVSGLPDDQSRSDSLINFESSESLHHQGLDSTGQTKLNDSIKEAIVNKSPDAVQIVQQWLESLRDRPEQVNSITYADFRETALHLAAGCNNVVVAKLLLDAGADPAVREATDKIPLHNACMISGKQENVTEMVALLLSKNSSVTAVDNEKETPLHLACIADCDYEVMKLLLDKGADVEALNDEYDSPIGILLGYGGDLRVVREIISRYPQCVHSSGMTPLHQACGYGKLKPVQEVLKANPDVNAMHNGKTPMHHVAFKGSVEIARLLLERGALVNPPQPDDESNPTYHANPFHTATIGGHAELALFLLENGATVTPEAFKDIVEHGNERIATEVIESRQWPLVLRQTYQRNGKTTTPFRDLIRKMPDLAESVLNKCVVPDPEKAFDLGNKDYRVVYNYEFVEDYLDGEEPRFSEPGLQTSVTAMYGISYSYMEYFHLKNKWGPSGFSKFYHPLAIMVRNKRLNLLNHPVIGSLLHYKWKKFGQYGYFINLLTYIVFLAFLTSFALVVPSPQEDVCRSVNVSTLTSEEIDSNRRNFLYLGSSIVILFASFRLLLEAAQLVSLRHYYVIDWVNWMEIALFVCSIIFAWVYTTTNQCVLSWQWQVGVVAVFLGWIDLIVFISKFPLTGIYVLMFVKILYTFLKLLVLSLLLIIAFGLTFFMILFDPSAKRSPFSDAPRSLLKTMTMTTGELDFDAIFRLDPAGGSDDAMELEYLPISYILWILFIVLMPILLTNMLVGLAVGDIEAIQKEAELQKLALQVEQVLTVEELLPRKLRRKFRTTYREVYPNDKRNILSKFGFVIWGGDHYDSHASIKRALYTSEDSNEQIMEKISEINQVVQKRNDEAMQKGDFLASEVVEMKKILGEYQFLVREIAKKVGVEVPINP